MFSRGQPNEIHLLVRGAGTASALHLMAAIRRMKVCAWSSSDDTLRRLGHLFRSSLRLAALWLVPLGLSPRLAAQDDPGQAVDLMRKGEFRAAEAVWRKLESQHPKDGAIHSGLGVALAQQGRLEEAIVEYRRSLALNPKQSEVQYDLGIAEFKRGHFAEVLIPIQAFAKSRPEDPRSDLLLGMSYYGLRNYAAATPYLRKAVEGEPANLELRNTLAQSCLWGKDYQCALEEFKSILSANPDATQAHMLLAQALDGMDKTAEATTELEEAARVAPKEPVLHFELGYLYYKQRVYDRARTEFSLEIQNNPGYAQAYLYLGDIALHANDAATAEPFLKKAVELQDESRLAYFDLGSIYGDQGRNQEALSALRHAVALDPAEPDAHYRLARLYAALGQKDKAAAEFAKTKELHSRKEASLIEKVSGEGPPPP